MPRGERRRLRLWESTRTASMRRMWTFCVTCTASMRRWRDEMCRMWAFCGSAARW